MGHLRQRQYPTGCGKAYDVALLSKWLEAKLLVIRGEQGDAIRVQYLYYTVLLVF